MSKAFTRESDDEPERPVARPAAARPPGVKNYLTLDVANLIRHDLDQLDKAKRMVASEAGPGEEAEAKRKLQLISQKMRELEERLRTAEVVSPPLPPWEQVRFGATVRVRDEAGEETRYRIVGAGDTDMERDWISWVSPIARALLNRRVGDKVKIRVPAGEKTLEVLGIGYD